MKKKNLKWRLSRLPGPEELRGLVGDGIMTKDEARGILFKEQEEIDIESLKDEIKFLRELVDRLSENRDRIVETIRIVEKPYQRYDWYQPYYNWSYTSAPTFTTASDVTLCGTTTTEDSVTATTTSGTFTNITTF
jgi:hypothetical protein